MLKIYNSLLKEFGEQNWWPTQTNNKFEMILGAILTQNTSWKNTEKALNNLKKNNLINIKKINNININKLKSLIKPAGFYNQKAETIKLTTNFLIKNKSPTRKQLLNLKGIGKETADSILLYAYNKPNFVIDAYTKRIMKRLNYKFKDYNTLQELFTKNLPKDYKIYNEFHALLVELAKRNCKKTPDCNKCILRRRCSFR